MDSAFRAVYQSALEDRRRFIAGFPAHKLTHVLTRSSCMLSKVVASRLR